LFCAEPVLKELAGRTDGYITWPFEVETLVRAVKTVLSFNGKRDGG